jgi:hypothetical protein
VTVTHTLKKFARAANDSGAAASIEAANRERRSGEQDRSGGEIESGGE